MSDSRYRDPEEQLVAELVSLETILFIAYSPDPDEALHRTLSPLAFGVPREVPGTDECYERRLADLNQEYGKGAAGGAPSSSEEAGE